jgi:hypothetical protein
MTKNMKEPEKKKKPEEENIEEQAPEYKTESELAKSAPEPVADPCSFEFNDLKKGQLINESFTIRNAGGPYSKLELSIIEPDSFLRIVKTSPLDSSQPDQLPACVYFEAHAEDWSQSYSNTIVIRLDEAEEKVTVDLNTQSKPINDFAGVLKPQNKKIITALIDKLERNTSAEIAVVTVDSLEGKTIEKYANELFNEWGVGKEGKDNGILILIDLDDSEYRAEVGLGLEKIIKPDFLKSLFKQYAIPEFKLKRFGEGIIHIIKAISAKITSEYNS